MAQKRSPENRRKPRRPALTAEDVALEARTLRQLFAHFGALDLRPVEFELDESPLVRAFWESFGGFSPYFLSVLEPPEREHARRQMPALLADYRRGRCRLTLADLPTNYRLVDIDTQGLGLRLTDEESGSDPIILELDSERSKIARTKSTYLRTCARELVALAMSRMYRTVLRVVDPDSFPKGAAPLLPKLAQEVSALHEGVWRLANDHRLIVLAHASTDALIAWLESADVPAFTPSMLSSAGACIDAAPGVDALFEVKRMLTGPEGTCRFGQVDGIRFLHIPNPPLLDQKAGKIVINPRFVSRIPDAWRKTAEERRRTISGEFEVYASPTPPIHDESHVQSRGTAFERLKRVLDECVPEHRAGARQVELENDTPLAIVEFWKAIGWSQWTREVLDIPPGEGRDRTAVTRLLSRWMQEARIRDRWQVDPGDDAMANPCFPRQFRAIQVHESSPRYDYLVTSGGTSMILADESDGTDDPALFQVMPHAPRRDYLPWRYTTYVARKLIMGLLARRSASAWPQPSEPADLLAPVLNGLRALAPGIWSWSHENGDKSVPTQAHSFVFASMRTFVPYLLTASLSDLACLSIPHNCRQLVTLPLTPAQKAFGKLEKLGLRVASAKDSRGKDAFVATGILVGCPVVSFLRHQLGLWLHAEAEDTDALRAWAAEQGFGIREPS